MALEAFELGLAKLGMTGCKRDDRARCQGDMLGLMRLNFLFVVAHEHFDRVRQDQRHDRKCDHLADKGRDLSLVRMTLK